MTKWTKVLGLSAFTLLCTGAVLGFGAVSAMAPDPPAPGPPGAPVRVAVIQVLNPTIPNPDPNDPSHWLYKVRPGTVVLDAKGTHVMFVTNYTALEMTVTLGPDFPADTPKPPSSPVGRQRYLINFKAPPLQDGSYTYKVELKDAKGNMYSAEGDSAPHVIIDP